MSKVKQKLERMLKKRMWHEMLSASTFMDEKWYSSTYNVPEENAVDHYIEIGCMQGYDPSPFFSTSGYYNSYPDVVEEGVPALVHYIHYGRKEGRLITCSNNHSPKLWGGGGARTAFPWLRTARNPNAIPDLQLRK